MENYKKHVSSLCALLVLVMIQGIMSCTPMDDFDENTSQISIYRRIQIADRAQFDSLIVALDRTGLSQLLSSNGNFTLFAKRNQAFNEANVKPSIMNVDELRSFMEYYIVTSDVKMDDLQEFTTLTTLSGDPVYVSLERWFRTLNGRGIHNRDVFASNGTIQVMNSFIPRPTLDILESAQSLGHTTFVQAVDAANLRSFFTDENNPVTVFVPNNAAFAGLLSAKGYANLSDMPVNQLQEILKFHVLANRRYYRDLMKPFTPGFETVWRPGADVNTVVLPSYFSPTTNGKTLELINRGAVRLRGRGNAAEIDRITGTGVGEGFTATNGVIHVIGTVLLYE